MNSKRGMVEIEADGVVWRLRLTTNGMVRYQDKAGETITEAFRAIDQGSKSEELDAQRFRRLFWAVLSAEHDVTEEDAGDIMDAAGFQLAAEKMGEAIRAAFPEAKPGNVAAPPKAAAKKAT